MEQFRIDVFWKVVSLANSVCVVGGWESRNVMDYGDCVLYIANQLSDSHVVLSFVPKLPDIV